MQLGTEMALNSLTGADVRNIKQADAGLVLAETLRNIMYDLEVDDGLQAFGYSASDIPDLVKGTLPQVGCVIVLYQL